MVCVPIKNPRPRTEQSPSQQGGCPAQKDTELLRPQLKHTQPAKVGCPELFALSEQEVSPTPSVNPGHTEQNVLCAADLPR